MIYTSEAEVIALVEAFHKRMLSPTKWSHAEQLTVTLYYGLKFPYAIAFDLLKDGLKWVEVNQSIDPERQDTAIHFWLQTLKSFAIKYRNIDDLSALANIFVATYKKSEMPFDLYSQEIVFETGPTRMASTIFTDPATVEMPLPLLASAANA